MTILCTLYHYSNSAGVLRLMNNGHHRCSPMQQMINNWGKKGCCIVHFASLLLVKILEFFLLQHTMPKNASIRDESEPYSI